MGEKKGKVRLQKLAYLISLAVGMDDKYFEAGYFGPYSGRVAYEIDKLCNLNLMREEISPLGDERVIHTYSLTSQGRALCEELIKAYPQEYERIRDFMAKTKDVQDGELVKATKTCMLVRVFFMDEVGEKASRMGWQLSKEDVKEALEKLERMDTRWWV